MPSRFKFLVAFSLLLLVSANPRPVSEAPLVTPSGTAVQDWSLLRKLTDEQAYVEAVYREAASKPIAKKATARASASTGVSYEGDVWAALARCESGGTNASTGNGFYGYFQFVPSTWRSLGYSGLPTDYGYETQREAAQALQARSGWGQWPACSRKLGLR